VQQRARRRSARQDEPAERRQLTLEPIDRLLEALDVGFCDRGLGHAVRDPRRRIGQARPEREEILLNLLECAPEVRIETGGARGAKARGVLSKSDVSPASPVFV
jgi:hypothetical protein